MKTKQILVLGTLCLCAWTATAQNTGVPKIQFETLVYDFGKTSLVASVTGTFKFKNVGDAVLKLDQPKPSCGCTVAELKPDTLPPGASGELPFTLNLGLVKATMEKHIAVHSNDPKTPDVSLTIKVDYTPLFEINPMTLSPNLAFGVNDAFQFTTLTRTDGKPIQISKLETSKPWIKAKLEPVTKADGAGVRIRVAIQREGTPRRYNEYVHIYSAEQPNSPVSSIYLSGQIMGEVALSPEALYWSITDSGKTPDKSQEDLNTKRVTIRAANGKSLQLKNPQSTIKGIKLEMVPKEAGKVYELVARLDEVPAATVSGNVSFETSVASQARIEVPVIINVFKP